MAVPKRVEWTREMKVYLAKRWETTRREQLCADMKKKFADKDPTARHLTGNRLTAQIHYIRKHGLDGVGSGNGNGNGATKHKTKTKKHPLACKMILPGDIVIELDPGVSVEINGKDIRLTQLEK